GAGILIETYEIRERASGIDRHPVLPQFRSPVVSAGACCHLMRLARILLVLSLTRKRRELRGGRVVQWVGAQMARQHCTSSPASRSQTRPSLQAPSGAAAKLPDWINPSAGAESPENNRAG